jgi:hypothetical protein
LCNFQLLDFHVQHYAITLWSVVSVILAGIVLAAFKVRKRSNTSPAPGLIDVAWLDREASEVWEPTAPDPLGRRKAFRRRGNHVFVEITCASDTPRHGWVVNRSSGGIALAVDCPVAVGRVVLVLPRHAPAGTQPIEVIVRWCLEREDHHELGCQFAVPLAPSLLLLFG